MLRAAEFLIFCFLIVSPVGRAVSVRPYKIVCYLGSWANYRPGDGKFLIEDIDPTLCTHLVYGFAKLGHDSRIAAYDPYLDLKENWGLGAYKRFTALKLKNPSLKTLLAIGGWNEGSAKYSRMARDAASRKVFIRSCVEFLQKFEFDGLDLDWEYPATRGGKPEDKRNFVLLLKELHEAFRPQGLLLTSAVSAGKTTIDLAYDIPAISKYLDIINLMTYDFHGGWDNATGHNSPLHPRPEEFDLQKTLNVDYAVKYWLKKGAPPDKIVLGMPLYGRTFTLEDSKKTGLDAPITGKGIAGEFTREQGYMGYNEICKKLKKETGWVKKLPKYVNSPYAFKDRLWIGYDDVRSISEKTDYLIKMKLGGAMVWSLETDDFRGKCYGHRYPLLRAINSVLNGTSIPLPDARREDNDVTSASTTAPTPDLISNSIEDDSVATKAPASPRTGAEPDRAAGPSAATPGHERDAAPCPRQGHFRHPGDCRRFYLCQALQPGRADSEYRVYRFSCGAGTVFSEELRTCTFPSSAEGCSGKPQ